MPSALRPIRRRGLLAAGLTLPIAGAAMAFPDRPVRMVLGFPPGTGPDVAGRLLAEALRDAWPAGIVVDNRAGAAGHIAAVEVARNAAADGHTLLFGEVGQLAMAPSTHARLPYDPARDFAPVAEVAAIDFAFVVPASVPAADMAGYLAWAKARPQVFIGTFGAGTPGHFGAEMLASATGIRSEPVHFRSTGDAMTAVLGGEVGGMFGTVALLAPHVSAGQRAGLMPAVPTVAELGMPSLAFHAWFGLVAPAATPAPAIASAESAVLRALSSPALRRKMEEAGFRVTGSPAAGFGDKLRAETARWAEVVRATGFRAIE